MELTIESENIFVERWMRLKEAEMKRHVLELKNYMPCWGHECYDFNPFEKYSLSIILIVSGNESKRHLFRSSSSLIRRAKRTRKVIKEEKYTGNP